MSLHLLTRYGLPRDLTPPPSPSFSPDDIADLRLWLDAADASTITHSGGAVSKWTSKDANAREFVQTNGSLQPTTGNTSKNGLNTIDFDLDQLVAADAKSVWNFLHHAQHTVISVQKFGNTDTPDARHTLFGNENSTSVGRGCWFSYDDRSSVPVSDCVPHIIRTGSSIIMNHRTPNGSVPPNEYGIIRVSCDPAGTPAATKSLISYNDGTLHDGNTTTGTPSTGDSTMDLHIGGTGSVAFRMVGQIAEMLIYDRLLTASEIDDATAYLASKWGITLA